jgi:hypothetical protein
VTDVSNKGVASGSATSFTDPSGKKSKGVSNGLSCERKSGIFEQVIEEDDELSHHGGEGYFLGLTGSDQAGVNRLKYGVIGNPKGSGFRF